MERRGPDRRVPSARSRREQPDLQLRQRVDVRVAQGDRAPEHRGTVEQAIPAGDARAARPPCGGTRPRSSPSARRHRVARRERGVLAGDAEVGPGEDSSALSMTAGEERPATGTGGRARETGVAVRGAVGLERRAEPVPAGQVDPRLRPGEDPRDRPQASIERRAAVRRQPRCGRAPPAATRGGGRDLVDRRDRRGRTRRSPGRRRRARDRRLDAVVGQLVEDRAAGRRRPRRPRRRARRSRR